MSRNQPMRRSSLSGQVGLPFMEPVDVQDPVTPLAGTKRKKQSHVTRACTNCRRRRTRCDGRPSCATCKIHDDECIYDADKDGRKPASKQYIESLEKRIKQLERQVSQHTNVIAGSSTRWDPAHPIAEVYSPANLRAFRISHSGAIVHYGPTSTYRHLPEESVSATQSHEPTLRSRRMRLSEINWDITYAKDVALGVIPNAQVHRSILSAFFSYFNDWCQCDEAAFLADLFVGAQATAPLRTPHQSPFLHNAILAITLLGAPELLPEPLDAAQAVADLSTYAQAMIEEEMQRPMLSTVRGLCLLGSVYFYRSQRNLGWAYASMSMRLAQILGLNIECKELVDRNHISPETKTHRDMTFWSAYISDIGFTFNVGRTPTITQEDFETALPAISHDEDALPWYDHQDRQVTNPDLLFRAAWRSSTFHWLARLTDTGHSIQRALYRTRLPTSESIAAIVTKLEVDLSAWLVSLPGPLCIDAWEPGPIPPHIVNLHAVFHYWRILLHRPVCFDRLVLDDESRQTSLQACETSARAVVKLLGMHPAPRYITHQMVSVAFTAGTTWLLVSTQSGTQQALVDEAHLREEECIQTLGRAGWPAAKLAHDILRRLRDNWEPPEPRTDDGTGLPSSSSSGFPLETLDDMNSEVVRFLNSLGRDAPLDPGRSTRQTANETGLANFAITSDSHPSIDRG
ncbi:fungal-specific transcription factor domain-domain-containing protein [Naematelia encephala]|uniref:Fungal-specific transcription factor domain-domain-containing protein n=1 Tax=Naematelia encephala TaxID=71784 RepID=A0A1Y2B0V7_9TREE|nr:fungal-specific transcription factor domain-domain-containing protein [Naematelia encephala]